MDHPFNKSLFDNDDPAFQAPFVRTDVFSSQHSMILCNLALPVLQRDRRYCGNLGPSLENGGKIWIKVTSLLARFTLRKGSAAQPALHCAVAHSHQARNGLLTHALLAQSGHLRIRGQRLFTPSLLQLFQLWRGLGCSFGLPRGYLLTSRFLHLLLAMSRQMTLQSQLC